MERRLALASALEAQGDTTEAVAEYAAIVRLQPMDPDIRYRYAFALIRDGDEDGGIVVLDETLSYAAEHPASLLLLGSLLYDEETARAEDVLERFVAVAPDHPASEQVSALLRGDGELPAGSTAQHETAPHETAPAESLDEEDR